MTTSLARTRYATADDVGPVVQLHRRCSPDTLRQRFHVPVSDVPVRLVEQLVAPRGGWSLVAEEGDDVVALACAGPLSSATVEVGLLVQDAHQGRGIGSHLLRDVAVEASRRGYRTLVCVAQPDNESVLRTVRRAGLQGVPQHLDGLLEIVAPLPAWSQHLGLPA